MPFCCSSFRGRLIKDHSGKRTLFLSPRLGVYLGAGLVWPCWRSGRGEPQGHVWNACLDQFSRTATHIALNLTADYEFMIPQFSRFDVPTEPHRAQIKVLQRDILWRPGGTSSSSYRPSYIPWVLASFLHLRGQAGFRPMRSQLQFSPLCLLLPLTRTSTITRGPSDPPGKRPSLSKAVD